MSVLVELACAAAGRRPSMKAWSTTTPFGTNAARVALVRLVGVGADAVAEQRVVPAHPSVEALGVRVDQQLGRVEPMPVARLVAARGCGSRSAGRVARRAGSSARRGRSARSGGCAARSPSASKRHRSTASACSLKIAKLTPEPSHVAPSGYGLPRQTLSAMHTSQGGADDTGGRCPVGGAQDDRRP